MLFSFSFLSPEWKDWHRLWSMRVTIFWFLFYGAWIALPAFQNMMSSWHFLLISMVSTLTIGIARLYNQPGISL